MAVSFHNLFSSVQEVAGLHIYAHKDGSLSYFLCVLKKEKEEIQIQDLRTFSTQEDLMAVLQKKCPLMVALDGSGILHKKGTGSNAQFKQLFPQVHEEDFFIQKASLDPSGVYFSIIRQEKLERELSFLSSHNFLVKSIFLGPFVYKLLVPFIKDTGMVSTVGAHIDLSNNTLELLSFTNQEYSNVRVGEDDLTAQYVTAYALALSYWIEADHITPGQNVALSNSLRETLDKRRSEKIGKISIAAIFILALINALFYFNLYPKHQELALEYGAYQNLFTKYNKTSKELKERNELFNTSGMSAPRIPKSFMADQLAAIMPGSINLTQVLFNPIDESFRQKERKLRFKEGVIMIKGESKDAMAVNLWISELNKLAWVDKIHASKYKFDAYKNKGVFEFVINVKP